MRTHKPCNKCGEVKPFEAFYPTPNGYKSQCRSCHSASVRASRAANREHYREYDRKRMNDPQRRERQRLWYEADPLRKIAHDTLNYAIRSGAIKRPSKCQDCGKRCKPHGHHEDYSKPLDVEWLCPSCHGLRHSPLQ